MNTRSFVDYLFGLNLHELCLRYRNGANAITKYLTSSKRVLFEMQQPGYPAELLQCTENNILSWLSHARKQAVRNAIIGVVIECKLKMEAKEKELVYFSKAVSALRSRTVSKSSEECSFGSSANVSALREKCLGGCYSLVKIREAFETLNMVSRCEDLTESKKLAFSVAVLNDETTLAALSKKQPFARMLYDEKRAANIADTNKVLQRAFAGVKNPWQK